MKTCPTAFTYEESAALWRELRDTKQSLESERLRNHDSVANILRREKDALRAEVERLTADHAGARAERDFYRSALAEADAAAREARAERDALARALADVRAVVAMVPTGDEA